MVDAVAAGVGLAVHVGVLQLGLGFKIPAVFQIVGFARFDAGLLVPGSERAVRLSAINQEGVAVAHDLADPADDVDVLAVIAQPGVIEGPGVTFVLSVSVVKRIAAAKVGKDSTLMDRAAVITGGYEIFAQFKAIAVTGIQVTALMGVGRAGPPAVGIGVHIPNVTHALIQGIHLGC